MPSILSGGLSETDDLRNNYASETLFHLRIFEANNIHLKNKLLPKKLHGFSVNY